MYGHHGWLSLSPRGDRLRDPFLFVARKQSASSEARTSAIFDRSKPKLSGSFSCSTLRSSSATSKLTPGINSEALAGDRKGSTAFGSTTHIKPDLLLRWTAQSPEGVEIVELPLRARCGWARLATLPSSLHRAHAVEPPNPSPPPSCDGSVKPPWSLATACVQSTRARFFEKSFCLHATHERESTRATPATSTNRVQRHHWRGARRHGRCRPAPWRSSSERQPSSG